MRIFQLTWKYTEKRKGFKQWDGIFEDARIFIKRISTANPILTCTILLNELNSCSKIHYPECLMQKIIQFAFNILAGKADLK